MALIENIQREDLNPIEEAVALKRLQDEFELTHQEVAQAVGKSRTTVTNLLRLIALSDDVKTLLEHGDLEDRKSTRLNSSHVRISYAVFCLKKKKKIEATHYTNS